MKFYVHVNSVLMNLDKLKKRLDKTYILGDKVSHYIGNGLYSKSPMKAGGELIVRTLVDQKVQFGYIVEAEPQYIQQTEIQCRKWISTRLPDTTSDIVVTTRNRIPSFAVEDSVLISSDIEMLKEFSRNGNSILFNPRKPIRNFVNDLKGLEEVK